MKTFCIVCICFVAFSFHASAQKIVVDSSFANSYKKPSSSRTSEVTTVTDEESSDSFGSLVGKIGEGIWQRLKYRLNLEEVQESLEAKKERFINKPEDEQVENKGS